VRSEATIQDADGRDATWWDAPLESGGKAGFGLYLHIPFCAHRCGYCDFATWATDAPGPEGGTVADVMSRYVPALIGDLGRQVARGPAGHAPPGTLDPGTTWPSLTSIFIGGGTPTLLPASDLVALLAAVRRELDVEPDAEVTVECNPENASVELFGALADAGVTRVSMGVQSFVPEVLRTLERDHDPRLALDAVTMARTAGIPDVSLDLIYGTPGETDDDWAETLRTAVAAGTDHLSAYALTVHDGTSFGARVHAGTMLSPDDDVQRDRFDVARDILGGVGFEQYELSNWARGAARRSAHNSLYWRHGDYLAAGVGGHAHVGGRRSWQHRSLARWLAAAEGGQDATAGDEVTTMDERSTERLLLGLRLAEGLHPNDVPPIEPWALEDALHAGLVTTACGRLQCTADGWFLLDEAVQRLGA
jgi:putative oxygen-independent coproporphyrinogen III oxidase